MTRKSVVSQLLKKVNEAAENTRCVLLAAPKTPDGGAFLTAEQMSVDGKTHAWLIRELYSSTEQAGPCRTT